MDKNCADGRTRPPPAHIRSGLGDDLPYGQKMLQQDDHMRNPVIVLLTRQKQVHLFHSSIEMLCGLWRQNESSVGYTSRTGPLKSVAFHFFSPFCYPRPLTVP